MRSKGGDKRRVAAVVAVCALLVVVGCSAARCAVAGAAGGDGGAGAALEQEERGSDEGMTAQEKVMEALRGHAWRAEDDASKTVAFRDGSFVEAGGDGVVVTAFDVVSAAEGEDWCSLTAKLVRGGEGPFDSEIVVEGREGSLRVSCDGFANAGSYVEGEPAGGEFPVEGLADAYVEMAGGDADAVREAVASYCRAHVPAARSASFDGEVYLDMRDGRTVATFHCDDAARTILTVTYAGGALTVAG